MPKLQRGLQTSSRRATRTLTAIAGLVLLAAMPAWGVTTYQNNTSAFTTAATNAGIPLSTLDFSDQSGYAYIFTNVGNSGITFDPYNGGLDAQGQIVGTLLQHTVSGSTAGFEISFTQPINAFELTISGTGFFSVCVNPSGSKTACENQDGPIFLNSGDTGTFALFDSAASLNSPIVIRPATGSGYLQIQSFRYGTLSTVSEAPEPGTLFLMGGTLILFPLLTRRYRLRRR